MDLKRDSYNSTYISGSATTAITGAVPVTCKLIRITVGETAAGTIRVYNSIPGSEAAADIKAELKASIVEGTYEYDITMSKGIQVVSLAGSKFTVVWSKV